MNIEAERLNNGATASQEGSAKLANLSAAELNKLSVTELNKLQPHLLNKLNNSQIAKLNASQLSKLSAGRLASLGEAVLNKLSDNIKQAKGLSSNADSGSTKVSISEEGRQKSELGIGNLEKK